MGKLFGGGGKTQTSTSTSEQKPWAPAIPFLESILKDASNLYNTQGGVNADFIEKKLAELNPEMQGAVKELMGGGDLRDWTKQMTSIAQQGTGGIGSATNALNQFVAGQKDISPEEVNAAAQKFYQSDLVKSQKEQLGKDVQDALRGSVQDINQQASAGGSMGSSRAGVAEGVARGKAAEAIASGSAQIENVARQDALKQAMGIAQGNREQQFSAAGQLGNLGISSGNLMGGLGTAMGQLGSNKLQGAGILQNWQQQAADLDWMNKVGQQQMGWQQLMNYLNTVGSIGGMGGSGTGTQTTPKQSNMGGIGGLMGGAGGIMQGMGSMGMTFSDERLKEDVKTEGAIQLQEGDIRLVSWKWNKLAEEKFGLSGEATGVIAQELEQVFPQCVKELAEVDGVVYKGVDYGLLDYLLLNIFKQYHQRMADTFSEKIKALEEQAQVKAPE